MKSTVIQYYSAYFYYPKGDGTMILTNNENDCIDNGFNYSYRKECKKNCDDYFKLMNKPSAITIECFKDFSEVIIYAGSNDFFYEKSTKKFWMSMPSGYFILSIDHNKFEIVAECDNYYYNGDLGRKYCIENCKNKDYYFYRGRKNCETSCSGFNDIILNYYIESTNECLVTCSKNLEESFAFPIDSGEPKKCISKCPKYYIEINDIPNNIIYKECNETCDTTTYVIDAETNQCIRNNCPEEKKLKVNHFCYPLCNIYDNYIYINTDDFHCSTICPSYLPKIELLTRFDNIDIYLCKSNCHENDYRLEDKCLEKCPEKFNYIGYNRICNENCHLNPNGEYYYPVDTGPSGYTIYKCVSSCEEANIIDVSHIPHTISESYPFYSNQLSKECFTQCPNNTELSNYSPFYLGNKPHECLPKCPDEFPFYDKDANYPQKYECKKNNFCSTEPFIYFVEGECVDVNTNCFSKGLIYLTSDNICLPKCREGEIKQKNLHEDYTHDGTYSCKKTCGEFYIYFENELQEPECVIHCPRDKPFIGKNNICKLSCEREDGFNYYEINITYTYLDYSIYKCIPGCNEEYNLKQSKENTLQCYKECPSNYPYISREENICYDHCIDSPHNKFTLIRENEEGIEYSKECTDKCDNPNDSNSNKRIYYGDDKVCQKNCSEYINTPIKEYIMEMIKYVKKIVQNILILL